MAYYDWKHLTKPFRYESVAEDTTGNTKPLTTIPVDWVKTGLVLLKIPAQTFTPFHYFSIPVLWPPFLRPLIIGQYNYTASAPLTILDPNNIALDRAGTNLYNVSLCVRYRVGVTVHRYVLKKTTNFYENSFSGYVKYPTGYLPFPEYTNQTILGNFVIEVWQTSSPVVITPPVNYPAIRADIYLSTGIIFFPESYEDVSNVIEPVEIINLPVLKTAFPAGTPPIAEAQDASGPWLTN